MSKDKSIMRSEGLADVYEVDIMRSGDVCKALGISIGTLNARVKAGAIPAYRIGGTGWRVFLTSDIQHILQRSKGPGGGLEVSNLGRGSVMSTLKLQKEPISPMWR